MTDLRTAALRALEALEYFVEDYQSEDGLDSMKHYAKCNMEAINALRAALSQPEDKSQAAFEHWVDTVEATQGCAISRNAVVDKLLAVTAAQMAHAEAVENLTVKESLTVEPCNKSCAPGYCYCEPIIKPEIKGHNVEPPPEAQTEAERVAYCAGWWAAMEAKREQNLQGKLLPWKGLTVEEHNYYKALGFVGVKAVEEKLRAKNSTLVSK
jgi:hypothetical protein